MNTRILKTAMAVVSTVAMTLGSDTSCSASDKSTPSTFDGVRTISAGFYGMWEAPGGTGCQWKIWNSRTKVVSLRGPSPKHPTWSQTVLISNGVNGLEWRSSHCGVWKKK